MTRGDARELAVHLIYAREFTGEDPKDVIRARLDKEYYSILSADSELYTDYPNKYQKAYLEKVVSGVSDSLEELNGHIAQYSIGWDISRISRLARVIMQLAVYEALYVEDVPMGVAISEAVRIAKKYDGDDTGAFVNGILGSFARGQSVEV